MVDFFDLCWLQVLGGGGGVLRSKIPAAEARAALQEAGRDFAGAGGMVVYLRPSPGTLARPVVVCLCGSTRFYDAWQRANYDETMAGRIVLAVGFYPHSAGQAHGEDVGCTPEQKQALDELHLRKIDLADEVLILNVGGYVGESTRREIAYAREQGKPIRWLEPPDAAAEHP